MAVDLHALAGDLGAETDALLLVLVPLDEAGWVTPTPAPGWRVQEQIAHLAYFDEQAALAATDADAFTRELEIAIQDPDGLTGRIATRSQSMTGREVLAWFRSARQEMVATFLALDPSARVPWYGPPMSVASSLTARVMETWAHGQDVYDALGVAHPVTGAVRQVCHLGIRTFGFAYVNRGLEAPDVPVRVELTAPGGEEWSWGPEDAVNRVTGPALDFALVVTRRLRVADSGLVTEGPVAAEWMGIAQAFAGPPGEDPAPRA